MIKIIKKYLSMIKKKDLINFREYDNKIYYS